MQSYLFNVVVETNRWTMCTFSFQQKIAVLISSGFGLILIFVHK